MAVSNASRQTTPTGWLAGFASFLFFYGMLGFSTTILSAFGALDWLPSSVEWPVGVVDGALKTSEGLHVVPHIPSARIEIYDRDWRFLRGWHVDSSGGDFKLAIAAGDRISVITARGHFHYVFTTQGDLVWKEKYPGSTSYSSIPDRGERVRVNTPLWLWPFANPMLGLFLAVCGAGLLRIALKLRDRTR